MKITVKIKNVYGTKRIYPICPIAILFASIEGNKTLSDRTISAIKELGYEVEIDLPTFKEGETL